MHGVVPGATEGSPHGATDREDRALVNAILGGSNEAFEELVCRHQRLCWAVISQLVDNGEDVRDLCQECFLQVYRYLHTFRFDCSLRAWVARLAYSLACKYLRKKRIDLLTGEEADRLLSEAPSSEATHEESAMSREALELVRDNMTVLSRVERAIVGMHYLEEMSISEVSQATGLATGTIKSHLFRSRRKLRIALQDAA